MKIVHWNCSKKTQPITGIKRYENELFDHIKGGQFNAEISRIQRNDNVILGNTIFSWFFTYKKQEADLVHATCQTIAPVVFFQKNYPSIITVLDIVPLIYPSTQTNTLVRFQWSLIPFALKKINRIITISEFTKNELVRVLKIPESKIYPIYLGIDHSLYCPNNKELCKNMFGLSPNNQYILVVASNLHHKRMDLAQKIIKEIRTKRKGIKMIKVGYGEQLQGDGIINLGLIPEEKMPMLYNAADLYLHTSEYEGFGLPILEAMACGTPVVASNRASIPEIVENTGTLIDISSQNCIELFVNSILDNIGTDCDKAAIEQSKKFSWDKTALETVSLYGDIWL